MKGLFAVMSVCTLAVAGCESTTGMAPPSASSAAPQSSTDFVHIRGEYPTPAAMTNVSQDEAPVGGCVNLSGTAVKAVLTLVDCGSQLNTYRIVQRVDTPNECADADRPYYHNSTATGQFTACLDLAWDASACLSLGQLVTKVSCTDPGAPDKIKPLNVLLDTTTVTGCPSGGYPHPTRRFTICTQKQP